MTILTRQVQRGQTPQPAYIYLGNLDELATRIVNEFCTSKRAFVPGVVLGRVLSAMSVRRVQPTSTTPFSAEFDRVVASNNGIVPAIANDVIRAVPVNGSTVVQGEIIQVQVLPSDYVHSLNYVNSQQFIVDINIIKVFAQAQGIVMVPINCFLPLISVSSTLRYQGVFDSRRSYSLPFSLHTATTNVVAKSKMEAASMKPASILDPESIDIIGIAEGKSAYPEATPVQPVERTVTVPYNEFFLMRPDDVAYRTTGRDDIIDSAAKAYATAIPIFIFSGLIEPDWLDLAFQTRLAIRFEDQRDLDLFINSAFTFIIRSFAAAVQRSEQAVAGLSSSRARAFTPVPAESNADYPIQHGPPSVPEDRGYSGLPNPGETPTRSRSSGPPGSGFGQGLQRPNPPGKRQGGRGIASNAYRQALGQRIGKSHYLMPYHERRGYYDAF